MKKTKSYFMRTFLINEIMLMLLLLFVIIQFSLRFVEKNFLSEKNMALLRYSTIMREIFGRMINAVDWMIILSLGIVLLLIIPELIYRIVQDSLMNWGYSIWMTYRIRKFLFNDINSTGNNNGKARIIQNSIIDIRRKNITYFAKLPNNMYSQKKYIEMKEILYKEITSQFPDYSFSQIERYKHWVEISGTKIR